MLKILIVGLGSIGRKHLTCLNDIGGVEVLALRTSKGTLKNTSDIQQIYSIDDALVYKPNGVIISNPTALHVETAIPFLKLNIPVLIEKPVAYSFKESKVLNEYSSLIRIAYCMRFHQLNKKINQIIEKEEVFKLGFKRSFYLPNWHPYADYRTEYVAREDLGGGVIRTLSHEIDLMMHWFGFPESVTGIVDKVSDLEINTDDYAFFSCKFKPGFRVNFELDLLSPTNINCGELYTNKGKYNWDIKKMYFTDYKSGNPMIVCSFTENSIDKMYMNQINDFLGFVKNKKSSNASLDEAQNTLKLIEKIGT